MPDISDNAVQAATASETAAVFLTLLTIYVDGNVFLRLVDDRQNLTSNGNVYTACAFRAVLPNQSSDGAKSCKLAIDNTDVAVYKVIKEAIGHTITCDVAVVLSDTPDVYEQGPLTFVLRNITADKNTISGDLYDLYIQDRKATIFTYSPEDFPGMYF